MLFFYPLLKEKKLLNRYNHKMSLKIIKIIKQISIYILNLGLYAILIRKVNSLRDIYIYICI